MHICCDLRPPVSRHAVRGLIALLCCCAGVGAGAAEQALVKAQYSHKTDRLGFRWDVNHTGMINDGSNDCFDGGLTLNVNGTNFSAAQQMMTADGREYVLSNPNMRGLAVTRRVYLDLERGGARYVEVFTNSGNQVVKAQVNLRSNLGSSFSHAITSSGGAFSGQLGKKDTGVLTISRGSRPCVLFLVVGRSSKVRPVVSVQSNRTVSCLFNLEVKAGATVALLHWVAQRTAVSAANAADVCAPFYKRRLRDPKVPKELRRHVVNFRVGSGFDFSEPGPLLSAVLERAEELGVDRAQADTLVFDEESSLRGTVSWEELTVRTVHGSRTLACEDVAMVAGGGGADRPTRVHLRNGEVFAGPISARGMRFATASGLDLALDPGLIHRIFLRNSLSDGRATPGAEAIIRTRDGNRLSLRDAGNCRLAVSTAWGGATVHLNELALLVRVSSTQPMHQIVFRDRTRLLVLLKPGAVEVATTQFGTVSIRGSAIDELLMIRQHERQAEVDEDEEALAEVTAKALAETEIQLPFREGWLADLVLGLEEATDIAFSMTPDLWAKARAIKVTMAEGKTTAKAVLDRVLPDAELAFVPGADCVAIVPAGKTAAAPVIDTVVPTLDSDAELTVPHCELLGGNLVTGALGEATIHLISAIGKVPIETDKISAMERDDDEGEGDAFPLFAVTLKDGGTLSGRLGERLLSVRAGERTWQIPTRHLMSYRWAEPETADEE